MKAVIWPAFHLEEARLIERYVDLVDAELLSCGHEAVICRSLEEAAQDIADADILVCWRMLPELLTAATRLKWVQFGSAGIDHSLFPELLASDVILTSLSGIHRTPLSEHILALMLALSRRLDIAMRQQAEHRYERRIFAETSDELRGKTVGILGIGKVGLELARLCKCFGMTVIGTKRTSDEALESVDFVYSPGQLDEVLRRSDYLVLVLPLTSGTKSLLGAHELGMLKPSVRIINVARGQMIDESALVDALTSGRLAGAGLDVFGEEPLPPESELWDLPNVILTPHVAGAHLSYPERAFGIFKANLDAFEGGSPMVNVFDRSRGY